MTPQAIVHVYKFLVAALYLFAAGMLECVPVQAGQLRPTRCKQEQECKQSGQQGAQS